MKLVTAAQMRELEQAAFDAGATPAQLMEEAGLAAAQEAWMLLGTLDGRRILVLAGPGNNGGDGMVAARHLRGWGAELFVYAPKDRPADEHAEALLEAEIPLIQGSSDADGSGLVELLGTCDLVIDGLLGIGRSRPLADNDPIARALDALRTVRESVNPPKLIAIDVASGMDPDSGAVDAHTVEPDLTVTFGLPKVGMYQYPGSNYVGRVQVIDIGIPKEATDRIDLELLTARSSRDALPPRPEDANKGSFGKVLVIGGSRRYRGAPALCATAVLRGGAGLATIAAAEGVIVSIAPGIQEATWLPMPESEDGTLAGEAAVRLRQELGSFDAVVLGPGLGQGEETGALVWALLADLASVPRGFVLDADGLNALAAMDDGPERVPANAVLTPHPGEMARLLGTTVAEVQADRLGAALEAAKKYGCVVVLKGAHTVVANAEGAARLCPYSNPLLASAGTGDVLAGMIAAYLGQGLDTFKASCLAVYLHAAAGEGLRETHGVSGLRASEMPDQLPNIVKELSAP